ncbi:MAG: hypothetical protein P8N00_03245 [Flavobacteriales bacterium]|jgi:tetratricopeptide (TPR) repeat protein|nr:hypothetical protein [Flavobacteriales bacterium]|tara:strand:- start:1690 stop:3090 length:1401 start_codon:yes stop_codon:yes gene_type:complete
MYEDDLTPREDNNTKHLISRFNKMIESQRFEYFESEEIERIIDHYCEKEDKKKIIKAFSLYEKLFPFSFQLNLKKAQVLIFFDRPQEALSKLEEISTTKNEDYLYTLSIAHSKLKHHTKSIEILEELLITNPFNEEIISSLANEYQYVSDYSRSNDMLEKLLMLDSKNDLYWYTYIISSEIEENSNRAIDFIKKYLHSNPYDYEAWFYLGAAYQRKEDHLNAIEAFDYTIYIQDDFVKAYINKADSLSELGYYQNAIDCCLDSAKYREPNAALFYDIGDYYEKLDNLEKAKSYFHKSIKKDENFDESWFALALIIDLQGQHIEASYHLKKAIDINPTNIDYLFSYAQIHEKVGFIKEAEIAYRKVLELDEFDSETWLNYSHLLFQYESYSEAIDLLKKAIKINPKKAELSYRISAYLFKSGNDELGLKFFKEALIINYEKHEDFFRYIPSVKSNIILLNLLTKHKK